jgi:hypothetical protein
MRDERGSLLRIEKGEPSLIVARLAELRGREALNGGQLAQFVPMKARSLRFPSATSAASDAPA